MSILLALRIMLEEQIMIFPDQIRAARAFLRISQGELAARAGVGIATIKRIEASTDVRGTAETFVRLQETLEEAGVEFIAEDDTKGPGVRLKTPIRT